MDTTQQQHSAHIMGNENIPSSGVVVQQQQIPTGVHMSGVMVQQQQNPAGVYMNGVILQQQQNPPGIQTNGLIVQQQQNPPGVHANGLIVQQQQYPTGVHMNGVTVQQQQNPPGIQMNGLITQQGQYPTGVQMNGVMVQQRQNPTGVHMNGVILQPQQTPAGVYTNGVTLQQQQTPAGVYTNGVTLQQQQTPAGVHMNGVDIKPASNPSLPLVKPEAFQQYQASSRISEKNIGTQPHSQQSQLQQNTIANTQAAADPSQAQEWPLNLISAAFKRYGYTIAVDQAHWIQASLHLFDETTLHSSKTSDQEEDHPALDPTLTWHRLTGLPIVPRFAINDLTDDQQATAVVAKIVGAGLPTRLPLDKAFVLAIYEFLLSLTLPISTASTQPLLVKCHHCGAPTLTRVEHVRGAATWGCMYLMCFFWLPCLSVMFWSSEEWMNKRHYCGVCGKLLALWEKMRANREKGTKVYTQWGSFRLQPGEELASYIREG